MKSLITCLQHVINDYKMVTAEIIVVTGQSIDFKLIANDEAGEAGKGTHIRFIVDSERFMTKTNGGKYANFYLLPKMHDLPKGAEMA